MFRMEMTVKLFCALLFLFVLHPPLLAEMPNSTADEKN